MRNRNLKLLIAKLRRMRFDVHRKSWIVRSSNWNCGWENWKKAEPKKRASENIGSGKGGGTPGAAATAGTSTA